MAEHLREVTIIVDDGVMDSGVVQKRSGTRTADHRALPEGSLEVDKTGDVIYVRMGDNEIIWCDLKLFQLVNYHWGGSRYPYFH